MYIICIICMYVWIYVCMCIYIYIYIYIEVLWSSWRLASRARAACAARQDYVTDCHVHFHY